MAKVIQSAVFGEYIYNHFIHENPDNKRNHFAKHVHNHFEIILFLRGDATYIIEDRKYKLKPFDLILIPPSRYHYIHIDSNIDYERYNILFPLGKPWGIEIKEPSTPIDVINCSENRIVRDIFSKMDRYSEFGNNVISDLLPGLIKEIFYNVSDSENYAIPEAQNMSPIITKALDYINKNLFTIKDIEEISSALFVAPTYFFRIFKGQMKISPKKYITVKRLITAERMILDGEKPTSVYTACGFSTYTAFYKRYVDYFGVPPSKTV